MTPPIDHEARPAGTLPTRIMASGASTDIVSEHRGKGRRRPSRRSSTTSSLLFRAYMAWFEKASFRL